MPNLSDVMRGGGEEEEREEEGETGCLVHTQASQAVLRGRRKALHFSRPSPEGVGATLRLHRR